MKLSDFKFKLPDDRIALYPLPHRDDSRMMVLHRKTGEIEHRMFKDCLEYFSPFDLFVFNDTKVLPARLYGNKEKTGARIEVFLRRELNPALRLWDVVVDPARKIRIGNKLYFAEDDSIVAEVIDNTTSRGRTLRFLYDGPHDEFRRQIYSLGEPPIPELIKDKRKIPADVEDVAAYKKMIMEQDYERFQCLFAQKEGAVTAPAAGLHFSREMLKRMEIADIQRAFITLHCGLSTFQSTDVEDLTKHRMDSEEMEITQENCDIVNRAKEEGHKIVAVGTTVQRAFETTCDTLGHINVYKGWTNKFIFPPFQFSVANAMFTNFQMPESTLLMLVSAFGGYENTMKAYKQALKSDYRFGPYGDVMLIID